MLISRFKKVLWLESRAPSKNRPEKPQINYRKHSMSTKEKQNGAILATFSISRYDNGETRHIQTKTPIWIHLWSNQFWNRIANVSVQKVTRNLHIKTCSTSVKTQPKISWIYTHQDIEQKEKCLRFPSYMSEKHFSTRSMTRVNRENLIFFLVFADQKHSSSTSRTTDEQVEFLGTLIILIKEYCGERCRLSINT